MERRSWVGRGGALRVVLTLIVLLAVGTTASAQTNGVIMQYFHWYNTQSVVGSIPALGNWNTANAVKLSPVNYPSWSDSIPNLPSSTQIEWKCIKKVLGRVK